MPTKLSPFTSHHHNLDRRSFPPDRAAAAARRRFRVRLVLLTVIAMIAGSMAATPASAILDGNPADPGDHDYAVLLSIESGGGIKTDFCSGVAIARKWVLSAAHCFYAPSTGRRTNREAVVATVGVDYSGVELRMLDVHTHPNYTHYDDSDIADDLALVELLDPIPDHLPILDIGSAPAAGSELLVVGYGADVRDSSPGLQSQTTSTATCPSSTDLNYGPTCLVDRVLGSGDSGGPILHPAGGVGAKVVGISGGTRRARPIDFAADPEGAEIWIENVMSGRETPQDLNQIVSFKQPDGSSNLRSRTASQGNWDLVSGWVEPADAVPPAGDGEITAITHFYADGLLHEWVIMSDFERLEDETDPNVSKLWVRVKGINPSWVGPKILPGPPSKPITNFTTTQHYSGAQVIQGYWRGEGPDLEFYHRAWLLVPQQDEDGEPILNDDYIVAGEAPSSNYERGVNIVHPTFTNQPFGFNESESGQVDDLIDDIVADIGEDFRSELAGPLVAHTLTPINDGHLMQAVTFRTTQNGTVNLRAVYRIIPWWGFDCSADDCKWVTGEALRNPSSDQGQVNGQTLYRSGLG